MKTNSSATSLRRSPLPMSLHGVIWGSLGVLAFSLTVPLTRIAVESDHMSALFVGSARAVVAACIAAATLALTRSRLPRGRQWVSVAVVAVGAVMGFPILTSFALTQTPASHGAVVIALLPAVTAVVSALRTGERPPLMFWWAAAGGAVAACLFAIGSAGGIGGLQAADGLLFIAVIVCATAYAEGGLLSRELGAWQTISWALVLATPATATLAVLACQAHPPAGTPGEWASFAYLSVVSMFLGFVAWYRGLAIGPIAQVSQIQLAQPVMSIMWAAVLLGEQISVLTFIGGVSVVLFAFLAVRARGRSRTSATLRVPSDGGA